MGVLSDLVSMKSQKDLEARKGAIEVLGKALLGSPTPAAVEWAQQGLTSLLDTEFGGGKKGAGGGSGGGGKSGGGKSVFHHIVSGLAGMNPYTANRGTKDAIRQIGASRPQQMEMTPDEQQARTDQQEQRKQQMQLQYQKELKAQEAQQTRETNQQSYEQNYKRLTEGGMPSGRAAEEANAIASGRAVPAVAAAKEPTERDIAFQAYADSQGKKLEELTAQDKISAIRESRAEEKTPTAAKPDQGLSQEVKDLKNYYKSTGLDDAAAEKKALADRKRELETKEKASEQRIVIQQQNASQNAAPSKPDTVNYWADYMSKGGVIPYGMMRSMGKKTVADIMAEVPKLAAARGQSVGDVIAAQSDVKSLEGALTNMEKSYTQTKAFEQTATQNLDRAIAAAGKIVDSGSPFINKPWREAEETLRGKPEYMAFHAARVVAFTEVAKVLNNPNGSGAVSDSARKEAEGALSPNATLEQLVAAADILKQDMQTRMTAMEDTIAGTKKKIALGGQDQKPAGATGAKDDTVKKLLDKYK